MDDVTREKLHARLDEILDRRAEIEPPESPDRVNYLGALSGYAPSTPEVPPADARELFSAMIELARDALGDQVRRSGLWRHYSNPAQQRKIVKSWLDELWPIINAPPQSALTIAPQSELTVFDLMDAISALDAGEIRPMFVANTGRNRRANRWSLAQTKLEALAWKRRLLALGYREKAANFEITKAFQEQWDTIRKWQPQCEAILGRSHVAVSLGHAASTADYYVRPRSGLFGPVRPDPIKSLQSAGDRYRAELNRSAELSKRKGRSPDA